MIKITTTDCYLPVEKIGTKSLPVITDDNVQIWLEKHTSMIVLTVEQFEKIVGDAFDAGIDYDTAEINYLERGKLHTRPDKEQYIATLLK